jgi:amino acid transporter
VDDAFAEDLAGAAQAAGTKAVGLEPGAGKYDQDLSRSLTFRENMLITLSSVTPASSVFIIVPAMIIAVGGASALAMAIASLVGITVALCYAELSSAFPITGGEYAFVARTLGKPSGFALFVLTLVSCVLIIGVIASGVGTYLGVLWSALGGNWIGILVIVVTAVVGCVRIRTNAWVTGVFLFVELAALAVLAILGFIHITQPVSTLWTATTAGGSGVLVPVGFGAVVAAMTTAIFALNGYGTAVYYAEETKQATKTIGRAILWSLVIVVVVELVPLIAVLLGTPSMSGLVGAADPMSYFLQARGGTVINDLVSLGIAIAIINAVLAIVLQAGRLVYSSARDRSWPDWLNRPFAAVHPRLRTPVVATLVVGVASALVLWLMPFNLMLTATGATVIITYLLVGLAALVGRITGRSGRADYKMPWWPLVTLVMIAATAVVTYETWLVDWVPVIVAIGMFLIGIPYYYLYLHPRRGDRWTLPDAPDEEIEE